MIKSIIILNNLVIFIIFILLFTINSATLLNACTSQKTVDNASVESYDPINSTDRASCYTGEKTELESNNKTVQNPATDGEILGNIKKTNIIKLKNVKVINKPTPRSSKSIPTDGQGMTVSVDPKTGKIRKPLKGEINLPSVSPQSVESINTIKLPGGGEAIPAPPSSTFYSTVTVDEEGEFKQKCTNKLHKHNKESSANKDKNNQ